MQRNLDSIKCFAYSDNFDTKCLCKTSENGCQFKQERLISLSLFVLYVLDMTDLTVAMIDKK